MQYFDDYEVKISVINGSTQLKYSTNSVLVVDIFYYVQFIYRFSRSYFEDFRVSVDIRFYKICRRRDIANKELHKNCFMM